MKHKKLSEKYRKWVIKYYSDRFSKAVYLIWLTDVSDKELQDKILTTKYDKIIIAKTHKKLIKRVLESEIEYPDCESLRKWLVASSSCKKISSTKYDLRKIESKILSDQLKAKDIEEIVNFINLFEDYKIQIGEEKSRTKKLNKIWNYFYDQIFFLNFKKVQQKKHTRSKLSISNEKLHKEFSSIIEQFESRFEFIKKN